MEGIDTIYAIFATFVVGQVADLIRDIRLRKHTNKTLIETAPQRAIEAVSLVLAEQRKASEFAQNLLKEQIASMQAQIQSQNEIISKQHDEIAAMRERIAKLEGPH